MFWNVFALQILLCWLENNLMRSVDSNIFVCQEMLVITNL